jgi:hypothetical protein
VYDVSKRALLAEHLIPPLGSIKLNALGEYLEQRTDRVDSSDDEINEVEPNQMEPNDVESNQVEPNDVESNQVDSIEKITSLKLESDHHPRDSRDTTAHNKEYLTRDEIQVDQK